MRADAILVLAGGRDHRLNEGLRLFRAGLADTLAISDGGERGWLRANRLCGQPRIRCFKADPYSTVGEAGWANRQGWRSVLVVTSRYHVFRTRLLFRRCFDERPIAVVGAAPPLRQFVQGVVWEWPKLVWHGALERGCE